MDDLISGLVAAVSKAPVGTQTAADAATTDTVLLLDDTVDLTSTGGQVTLNGVVTDYASSNDDDQTITLATPLAAPLAAGAEVLVYPPKFELTAMVLIAGASVPIPAEVPWYMQDSLRPGVREEEDREQVNLVRVGQWSFEVFNLPGQPLARDAVYGYVPTATAAKGSDDPIPTNTWSVIPGWFPLKLDRVRLDGFTHRFTVEVDGEFDLRVGATLASNNTGRRGVRMHYYSATGTDAGASRAVIIPAEGGTTVETAQYRRMRAGESVAFEAYQSSTADLNIRGSNIFTDPAMTDCAIRWMGPL